MIRALFVKLCVVLAFLLLADYAGPVHAASVETFVDQAVPDTSQMDQTQPLKAGDISMQDVLKTARTIAKKKKEVAEEPPKTLPPFSAPGLKAPAAVAAPTPLLPQAKTPAVQPAAVDSTANPSALLNKGMENIFGASPTPADSPAPAVVAPTASAETTANKGVSVSPLPEVSKTSSPLSAPAPTAAAESGQGGCFPHVSSWTKTCADAGYPANYVGQIHGETRTTCPEGGLQDVWVSNGCVPPDSDSSSNSDSPPNSPANGSCGASNGLAVSAKPIYDLCAVGSASPVSGQGPWRWNCEGVNGGSSVSCAAPVAAAEIPAPAAASPQNQTMPPVAEDATCGPANGQVLDNAPAMGLCAKGVASRVNGSGPWTWACSGTNGGRAVSCASAKKVDGACGPADGSGSDKMPISGLCDSGLASAVTGNGPWAWTCSGLNGGVAATCSASPRGNAVCGPATLNGHTEAPHHGLCSVGDASQVVGSGPWSWTCGGMNGGSPVNCTAKVSQNGACGNAHGTAQPSAPLDHLCASGKPSRVNGSGPWNWTCNGTDGGDTASCTATKAAEFVPAPVPVASESDVTPAPASTAATDSSGLCGAAAEMVAIEAPSKNLCKSGDASDVSGNGPWTWTCSDKEQKSSCSTLSLTQPKPEKAATAAPLMVAEAQTAACGSASGQGTAETPNSALCAVGKASMVKGSGPWTWSCTKGKSRANCQADRTVDGQCGSSNGSVQMSAPKTGLCAAGKPTALQGKGPWVWSCVGSGGGASISCSAAAQQQARVDGNCGQAANVATATTPAANLCESGVASSVYGEGPWTWTCSGLNGGVAASCSANKNAPPAPPAPGPVLNGLCGAANGVAMANQPLENLCSTGTPSSISGSGPWNWNCLGENGGMTVSCTAPLLPPSPISGVCGAANGVPTLTTPKAGLCNAGISSAVNGHGPWTWSCSGVNGGSAVGCVAPMAGIDGGPLPSITTPGKTAAAAPATTAGKKGLVTPRLTSQELPPLKSGDLPPIPSQDVDVPPEPPALPDDAQGVPPPPVRDMIQPAPALRIDGESSVMPGNHFVLATDVSSVPFVRGSDNFDTKVAATLDKLADILHKNGGVRITLTAYADNTGSTPREARRLSLSRALAIRDYLTSKGVSSARIDVRALGANVPSGEPDRVDIKAN